MRQRDGPSGHGPCVRKARARPFRALRTTLCGHEVKAITDADVDSCKQPIQRDCSRFEAQLEHAPHDGLHLPVLPCGDRVRSSGLRSTFAVEGSCPRDDRRRRALRNPAGGHARLGKFAFGFPLFSMRRSGSCALRCGRQPRKRKVLLDELGNRSSGRITCRSS